MSDEEREDQPGELLRGDGPGADDEPDPKRQTPQGERDDDPDHGYGQLAP
jgi:hypothetical protein